MLCHEEYDGIYKDLAACGAVENAARNSSR
jgi:hypothetical protein